MKKEPRLGPQTEKTNDESLLKNWVAPLSRKAAQSQQHERPAATVELAPTPKSRVLAVKADMGRVDYEIRKACGISASARSDGHGPILPKPMHGELSLMETIAVLREKSGKR